MLWPIGCPGTKRILWSLIWVKALLGSGPRVVEWTPHGSQDSRLTAHCPLQTENPPFKTTPKQALQALNYVSLLKKNWINIKVWALVLWHWTCFYRSLFERDALPITDDMWLLFKWSLNALTVSPSRQKHVQNNVMSGSAEFIQLKLCAVSQWAVSHIFTPFGNSVPITLQSVGLWRDTDRHVLPQWHRMSPVAYFQHPEVRFSRRV